MVAGAEYEQSGAACGVAEHPRGFALDHLGGDRHGLIIDRGTFGEDGVHGLLQLSQHARAGIGVFGQSRGQAHVYGWCQPLMARTSPPP